MAPKKKASAAKPAAKGYAKSAANEAPEIIWVRTQMERLQAQSGTGAEWLQEPHSWHCEQLEELLARLQAGTAKAVPQEVREGVEDYVAQFADGQDVDEDQFYIDRELYAEVLAPLPEAVPLAPYVRAPTSGEASTAVERLKNWEDASVSGVEQMQKLMKKFEECAEVQEAAMTRLGSLLADKREGKLDKAASAGLTPKTLTPHVVAAMKAFPRDAGVQRVGCSVLRGITVMDGGVTVVADAGCPVLVVETIRTHLAVMEVCKMGASFFYAMVQKTEATSLERMAIKSTDAYQVLSEALGKHPTDLKWACEVTIQRCGLGACLVYQTRTHVLG
eukprot:TRINITY_DN13045_c0_g1_i1.p1 TRINITY_DN13045_c0_g1~~TRINITY_DN13045_c0_g1_i1.p1  ORF type:complete len:333 (-),score=88.36 TRINITY_DN13045_c0_g1_i1:60-1058(-)